MCTEELFYCYIFYIRINTAGLKHIKYILCLIEVSYPSI